MTNTDAAVSVSGAEVSEEVVFLSGMMIYKSLMIDAESQIAAKTDDSL